MKALYRHLKKLLVWARTHPDHVVLGIGVAVAKLFADELTSLFLRHWLDI